MDLEIDLIVAELLASRLCHDLVGPIGAVSNGMEMLTDDEFGMADDALALASKSTDQAKHLLQFYRMAYGMAGNQQSDLVPMRELATGFLGHTKSNLDWPDSSLPGDVPDAAGKLLLNIIALAEEALPRGGRIGVALNREAGFKIDVEAEGSDAGLREDVALGLNESVGIDELTPHNIHGYFTTVVARRLGATLRVESGDASMRFSATVPL